MDEKTIARFWAKVDKSAGPDGCWLWTASKFRNGYGSFSSDHGTVKAHRVAWELANGQIPEGPYRGTWCACHRCDVRACCNPSHMFLGSHAENMADRNAKGRQSGARGRANSQARLTEELVVEIRKLRASGVAGVEVSRRLGVSQATVSRTFRGRAWTHVEAVR
jgi:hypothetical protein